MGYRVYRATSAGGPYTTLTPGFVAGTRYNDATAVAGRDYWYYVTALDMQTHESEPSEVVTARAGLIRVWMPGVNGAAGERVRIPINIANTAGIGPAHLRIVLSYDTSLIETSNITVARTPITADVALNADTATAGRVVIETSGGTAFAGEGRVFDLYATIRSDAPNGACGLLRFTEAAFQNASGQAIAADISATAQACVSGQCKLGDVDANGAVQMADASLVLKIVVKKVVPQGCQTTSGDMNGDELVDSADAVMIMRVAEDRPINPAPGELPVRGRTVRVYIPEGLSATPGGSIAVPVMIDDATGLSGCELLVSFPPQTASLVLDSVEPGTAALDFAFDYNAGPGFVRIAMSRDLALAGAKTDQTLAVLHFTVPDTAPKNAELPIALNEVKLAGPFGENFAWNNDVRGTGGAIAVNSLVCGAVVVAVVDDKTSAPITNAFVQLNPGPPFAITQNTGGLYVFACVNPGACRAIANAPDYQTGEADVVIQGGGVSTVTVRLKQGGGGGCFGGTLENAASPCGGDWLVPVCALMGLAAMAAARRQRLFSCFGRSPLI